MTGKILGKVVVTGNEMPCKLLNDKTRFKNLPVVKVSDEKYVYLFEWKYDDRLDDYIQSVSGNAEYSRLHFYMWLVDGKDRGKCIRKDYFGKTPQPGSDGFLLEDLYGFVEALSIDNDDEEFKQAVNS